MANVTAAQKKYLSWEFGVFFHYGIRTFNHGHHDWDGIHMSAETFLPTDFDPDSWIKTVKSAGAQFAVMTTKHHDGFAMWQSAYSDYSVAQSQWKNGRGDAVGMFTQACHDNDIGCGLYYSPNEWGDRIDFNDKTAADRYYYGQLGELLDGRYGRVDYLWFDGSFPCGYYPAGIIDYVRSLQPDIIIMGHDVCGIGNEDSYVPYDMTNVSRGRFFCLEGDLRMRDSWFWEDNEYTLKSVDELIGMYETGIGRGASMLLNLAPAPNGRLEDADVRRLLEWRDAIKCRYADNCGFDQLVRDGNSYILSYSKEKYQTEIKDTMYLPRVRHIVIKEDVSGGNIVRRWRLYATIPSKYPYADWNFLLCDGYGIGRKRIISVPDIRCPRFRLEITDADGRPEIVAFDAYR
ncbi:MAG: alpha-L-fucosidase [Clostridia bacterium]|nr:alpha-L-fucosidase [Clostridia bacterium]